MESLKIFNKYKIIRPKTLSTNFLEDANISDTFYDIGKTPRVRIENLNEFSNFYFISNRKNQKLYSIFQTFEIYFLWSKVIVDIIKSFYSPEYSKDVQFIPISVKDKNENLLSKDYFVVNNLIFRDIINYKKSKIEWYKESKVKFILRIKKFIPCYEAGEGIPLLEIEHFPGVFFIHDKVVEEIEKIKIKDIDIFDPEDPEVLARL